MPDVLIDHDTETDVLVEREVDVVLEQSEPEEIIVTEAVQGPPGPQGVPGPVGTIDNAGVLTKPMKLSEFDTPTLKAEARANLELEYIDCGTFN